MSKPSWSPAGGAGKEQMNWSLMGDEGKAHLELLDRVLDGGRLTPKEHDDFFEVLPNRIRSTCASENMKTSVETCKEALRVLHKRSKQTNPEPLNFADHHIVGVLRRLLERAAGKQSFMDALAQSEATRNMMGILARRGGC